MVLYEDHRKGRLWALYRRSISQSLQYYSATPMISDDISSLFQSVATGGGFYVAPTAQYSTPSGDIQNGTQAIYVVTHPDFSPDPKNYSPGVYRRASTAFLTLTYTQMAQTVIHVQLSPIRLVALTIRGTRQFLFQIYRSNRRH